VVHCTNRRNVARLLFSYVDQRMAVTAMRTSRVRELASPDQNRNGQ
jgi:hypothetical protein